MKRSEKGVKRSGRSEKKRKKERKIPEISCPSAFA